MVWPTSNRFLKFIIQLIIECNRQPIKFKSISALILSTESPQIHQMNSSSEQLEQYYQISSIINKRINQNTDQPQYLVKWKKWKQPTWEPQSYLSNVPDIIYNYQQSFKQKEEKERGKKAITTQSESTKNQKKTSKYNRLKKLSMKQSEDKQIASLSSISSFQSYPKPEIALRKSSRRKTNVNTQKPITQPPRYKQSMQCAEENDYLKREQSDFGFGCVYVDEVQRVLGIEKQNGKWMVQIKFASQRLQNVWVQRDLMRLLYPLPLLLFYEKERLAKGIRIE